MNAASAHWALGHVFGANRLPLAQALRQEWKALRASWQAAGVPSSVIITFQGLNMDIGHLRHIRWVQDDEPSSPINNKPELTANGKSAAQNRWIAYNKLRGQYSSAMEHAVPEQFWVDKTQCRYMDESGQIQNPAQADCAQAVSAVKAIAIAQAEGQRIYTINQSNAATALPKLSIGGDVGAEIRNAIQAGKEVTVHERQISAHGWTGYGYVITDPDTGAGAYLIEGKGNGGDIIVFCDSIFHVAILYTGNCWDGDSGCVDLNNENRHCIFSRFLAYGVVSFGGIDG
jgi:hypothetical protein